VRKTDENIYSWFKLSHPLPVDKIADPERKCGSLFRGFITTEPNMKAEINEPFSTSEILQHSMRT